MSPPAQRFVALAATGILIFAAGCSSDDGTTEATSSTTALATSPDDDESTTTTTTTAAAAATLDEVAQVVCDTTPTRMSADAEVYTAESYECTGSGENVRIDLYESVSQQTQANQVVLDFYRDAGDDRSLAELPLVCGPLYAVGFDTNEGRDTAVEALNAAGLNAGLCE